MIRLLVLGLVVVAACGNDSTPQAIAVPAAADKAKADVDSLKPLPSKDLVGYLTGAYHTSGNNPAMFVDRDKKLFVVMGKSGISELPLADPTAATTAFEAFLQDNGYTPNGKAAVDKHQHVQVDGKDMVVMSTTELFPEMPQDLKAHFTSAQYEVLYQTSVTAGMDIMAARAPVIWAYTQSLVVQGPGVPKQEFPMAKATDAFAAFRTLALAGK